MNKELRPYALIAAGIVLVGGIGAGTTKCSGESTPKFPWREDKKATTMIVPSCAPSDTEKRGARRGTIRIKGLQYGLGPHELPTLIDENRTDTKEVEIWARVRDDLDEFRKKYPQAGTPTVEANVGYDDNKPQEQAEQESVRLEQVAATVLNVPLTARNGAAYKRKSGDPTGARLRFRIAWREPAQDKPIPCNV